MASAFTEGGYDYEFITDLPEDLTCVLCHFAFKNPVQVEECGHKFCKHCFDAMKDHAESNCVELLCPLDRQKIEITRVFKDKSGERQVLNLTVKCQNFGDNCDWTGELREALEHETKCCNDETMLNNPLQAEVKQLLNRMAELEVKVKVHGQKLVEKNTQIMNQDKQIVNLNRHKENQERLIGNLNKHNVNQDKQIADQKKQIADLKNHSLNQSKQVGDLKKQIESLQKSPTNYINHQPIPSSAPLSMVIPNIEDESTYSPLCTAFQWKFNPTEVKSGIKKISPPFYNIINAYCFQLVVEYEDNKFYIMLHRYRGKYDHPVNEIKVIKNIDFQIHIFGKNGKLKIYNWDEEGVFLIFKHEMESENWNEYIDNGEIDSLTVGGYVHLHCFFNKIDD